MQALFDRVRADREQGFSIVDEELEQGLRSIDAREIPPRTQAHRVANFGNTRAGLREGHSFNVGLNLSPPT